MASELTVQTLRGPTSGANADTVLIPSGQTLDASAATLVPSSGQIIQTKTVTVSSPSTGSATSNINTVEFTPKFSNSIIRLDGVYHHGIGPKQVNLDGWGHHFRFYRGTTALGQRHMHDVFPGGFTVNYSYGPEWYINTVAMIENTTGHVAGTTYSYHQQMGVDNYSGGTFWMLNRCHASGDARGTTSLTVTEIAQ
jgi:hypothetical protein